MIKLSKLAKDLNITVTTLYNWKRNNTISFIKSQTGRNFVSVETYNELLGIKTKIEEKVVIYCRVSSSENKTNLETQKNRLISYANAKGYKIDKVITEIGSGLNDKRPKLEALLNSGDYTKILVEHKDRLCRHGFNYLQVLLERDNKIIEVINNIEDDKEDLIQDFISVITSYCARIYGQRRSKRKTEQLVKELQIDKLIQ